MKRFVKIICAVTAVAMLFCSCGDRAKYSYDDNAPSLCEAYADYFKVGAAINTWNLNDENSNEFKTIVKNFNVFTLENENKPDATHPKENQYNWGAVDRFVEFGEKYDVTLRGHTLLWHSQVGDWFFKGEDGQGKASAELLLKRIDEHVTTIVSRYKGKIDTWDVVNEVLSDDYGLRRSEWYNIVGDYDGDGDEYDFIEAAFIAARAADPDARLIINDYSLESSTNKAITMYNAVKKMLEDGTPIDGVGLQMHIGVGMNVDSIRENIKILSRLRDINPDFVLEITELDMSCYNEDANGNAIPLTKDQLDQFSKTYCDLFEMCMDLAEDGLLDSVVFWGIHDGVSWLNSWHENYPMLIGRDFELKDAYYDVLELPKKRK